MKTSPGRVKMEIEGREFTLFWEIDREALAQLTFAGRADWLRARIELTLLRPLDALEKSENEPFIWLAVTELVCAGIESVGGFYGKDGSRAETSFCSFVDAFMHGDFSARKADDLTGNPQTYCWHLQTYFRNGLDHGFAVQWGALYFATEPKLPGYLRPNIADRGIAICPRMLLDDFRRAVTAFFQRLHREGAESVMGQNFKRRFENVRQQRGRV